MTDHAIHGIIGYTITPFDQQGALDLPALDRSIDRMIEAGVHAIAPLGSTGEGAYLSEDEWAAVAKRSIDAVAGRVPTIVSVSDLTTAGAVRRARAAEAFGATAVMVLPTSYWKLQEEEIVAHYKAIGAAIGIPIMLYNNHAVSGIDMSVDLILKIVDTVENVTMVKESTGDIQRMHQLYARTGGRLPFYNGSNPLALEAFCAGAAGWCTAAANLIAKQNIELYDATREGRLEEARASFYRQLPLLEFILKGGLPKTIKAGLALTGLPVGAPRAPVQPLSEAGRDQLASTLRTLA
jgi:4-hydroxy-tetrahydrodipicolinate synthase